MLISSNEDGFNFILLQDKANYIPKKFNNKGNESNNGDDIILGVRNRKIRIMNSESESVAMMSHKILIKFSKESGEISSRVRFMLSEKSACPQVSSNVKEYL